MTRSIVFSSTLAGLMLLAASTGTWAGESQETARRLQQAGTILPLEEIVEKAERMQPGHVLEAELEHEDHRYIYEIELLDEDGVVHHMHFDAHTGTPLNQRERD